jgi:hypothetical protein
VANETVVPSFKSVITTHKIQGGSNRETAGGSVKESGLTRLNANSLDQIDGVALSLGLSIHEYGVSFEVDEANRLVLITPAKMGPNLMPARRGNQTLMIHLGGVFAEYPMLKESGTRFCSTRLWPEENPTSIVLSLQTALVRRHKVRSSSSSTADSKPQEAPKAKPATGEI